MPVAAGILVAVSVGAEIAGTIQQKRAADSAAATAQSVAQYNAKLDASDAAQIDLDAQSNIRAMREQAAVYMSRQTSAYAAAGVRVDTGSPLAVKAATAGRFAMREQQAWADSQAKEQRLASEGQAGIAEGNAKADQYHMEGVAAVINGAGKVAGMIGGAYESGMFTGSGTTDVSAGLRNAPPIGSTDLPMTPAGEAFV